MAAQAESDQCSPWMVFTAHCNVLWRRKSTPHRDLLGCQLMFWYSASDTSHSITYRYYRVIYENKSNQSTSTYVAFAKPRFGAFDSALTPPP
eukprot:scaffold2420_cov259-Pinguiococcus_pyrenoidosus.AAC.5